MKLIDADELTKTYCDKCIEKDCADCIVLDIKNAPTIKAEPVKRGKWDYRYDKEYEGYVPCCSICECTDAISRSDYEYRGGKIRDNNSNYCPNCGAKMED